MMSVDDGDNDDETCRIKKKRSYVCIHRVEILNEKRSFMQFF